MVRSALLDVLARAGQLNGPTDQVRVAVYKFSNRLTVVQAPTTNLSAATTAVRTMELDGAGGSGTNYAAVLNDILPQVSAGGDGSSSASRKAYFMLLTDGIADDVMETADASSYEWGNWVPDPRWVPFQPSFLADGENLQGLDASLCSPIKNKKVTVLTLNIDYVIPPNPDWRFQTIRDKLKGSINQNMNACASAANLTFNAGAPGSIKQAINTMFDAILASARLTR
ncbi:vWA domain-containing protein [uncultured Alsobacter sp.]|uniref:vWA domain-containing protein n=1 Tax=uncultured Alsobacter sp. TaxID=1748258 RepID=UPI0025DD7AEF|nr:vWA domain-containing protein [uncultured Alsobacter sp.]